MIHLIKKNRFFKNLYFWSYHVDLGHKKRATITLNRGIVHTPEQARSLRAVTINVPFIVTALIQTIIFYTFVTIQRGKFLSTCPPREVNSKLRGGRARFSCATLRMNIRSDHHAVVKRAPRLSADSLFFVSEALVSWETLEDRIFRHLKGFQKSWINLILLLFHIFPLWF